MDRYPVPEVFKRLFLFILLLLPHPGWAQLHSEIKSEKIRIGVILPLSGKYKAFGEATLKGILLGAGIFGGKTNAPQVKLIVEDSKGDPEKGKKGIEELNKAGVVAVLGPLLSDVSLEVARNAQALKIPLITFSQAEGIVYEGDYIFRNSLTPAAQARAIASFAVRKLAIEDFAILYPETPYGRRLTTLFEREVKKLGGRVVRKEGYRKDKTDFSEEIKRLFLIKEVKDEKGKRTLTPPEIDFDALFIPDYAERVGLIAPQLAFYNVKGLQLLGTNGWNSPDLIRIGGRYVEGAIFVDGFSTLSNAKEVKTFVRNFFKTYGTKPGILEAQGYETIKILLEILRNNPQAGREEIRDSLLFRIFNFPGVTGYISFDINGEALKGMYVLKVEDGRIILLMDRN